MDAYRTPPPKAPPVTNARWSRFAVVPAFVLPIWLRICYVLFRADESLRPLAALIAGVGLVATILVAFVVVLRQRRRNDAAFRMDP